MKCMYAVTLLVGFALFLGPVAARGDDGDTAAQWGAFRLLTTSGQRLDGRDGQLTDGIFTGRSANGDPIRVPVSGISALDVKTGNKAAAGTAIGALVGGLALGLTLADIGADDTVEVDHSKVVPVGAALVGVCALVGYFTGSRTETWQKIDVPRPALGCLFSGRELCGVIALGF